MEWLLWLLVFMLGAALGSFANVVIYRLPLAESVVTPPSHCFSCGARLTVLDLVPVLSYLLLRGRCRHCGHRFSARYALVETVCGLLAMGILLLLGPTWQALATFVICYCLVIILFIDLDHMIIPDEFVGIIAVVGVALDVAELVRRGAPAAVSFSEWVGPTAFTVYLPRSLVGLVGGAGLLLLLGFVFEKALGKPSMGGGDVKLAGAMGAVLGPGYHFLSYFLLAVVAGAVVGVALMALRLRGRRDYIPFGPMLAAAGIAVLLFGDTIVPWVIARFTL
ncbi:MAG: prepilin peptidase [Armatimonadetes bacterium]|nr:prepilin peptidase [Armatimonadota bacterium]